ncbi:hypothetical protein KTF21_06440 [Burkholderia multivorans]|uniref:hypothetical protein n=1 Tax=Burkholderia multivorans TaxID=87883 RepID=UPI001C24749A|nr:hypothetical protein [Burkholderia multivorans]MBU9648318.1 hypothetical protein [Burkholderia multivorans]
MHTESNAAWQSYKHMVGPLPSPPPLLNQTQSGATLGSLMESAEAALKDLHDSIAGLDASVAPLSVERRIADPVQSCEAGAGEPEAIRKLRLIIGNISAAADHVRSVTKSLRI